MACSVAGITSDANVLTNFLRLAAQRYMAIVLRISVSVKTCYMQISATVSRRDSL